MYIAGDFNVNTDPTLRGDGNTQKFKKISNSLFPLIDKPTRVTRHSATVIDSIHCNTSDIATCRSGIIRLTISDHYAVFCINNSIKVRQEKQIMTKRNYTVKNQYIGLLNV